MSKSGEHVKFKKMFFFTMRVALCLHVMSCSQRNIRVGRYQWDVHAQRIRVWWGFELLQVSQ